MESGFSRSELLSSCYAPVWNPAPIRHGNSGKGIDKVLVVGRESDTAAVIRQLSASPLFATTRFEQTSGTAGRCEYVLLVAPSPDSIDREASLTEGAQAL